MAAPLLRLFSCQLVTAEARVCARANPYLIFGGQSGTVTDFSLSSLVFPCQYHFTMALDAHISAAE
jgi:hypothetical protein